MTEFNETMALWLTRNLSSATWSQFEKELFTALVSYLSNAFVYGALGFICSDAEWAALPGITANGAMEPKPIVPQIPVQPAASDGSAADDRRFDRERRETTRLETLREEIISIRRSVKQFLLHRDLGGEFHSVAVGDGDMFAQINEGPDAPFARLKTHLGTPDKPTFRVWKAIYSTPAENMPVSEWMRQDVSANTLLTAHRQQLSENQRLEAFLDSYKNSPPVLKAWDEYCVLNPLLANQNLTDALAYIKLQEPNILGRLKPADIGFSPLAGAASGAPTASAPEPIAAAVVPMYTQAQMDRAVEEARTQQRPVSSRPPKDFRASYCWLHGYQRSHNGHECRQIAAGQPIRWAKRDTRPPVQDNTMVFDHSNCGHTPRCISVEDAQAATEPSSRHHAAGNAIRKGERPYDGSR